MKMKIGQYNKIISLAFLLCFTGVSSASENESLIGSSASDTHRESVQVNDAPKNVELVTSDTEFSVTIDTMSQTGIHGVVRAFNDKKSFKSKHAVEKVTLLVCSGFLDKTEISDTFKYGFKCNGTVFRQVHSDIDGRFTIAYLPKGTYSVAVVKKQHSLFSSTVVSHSGVPTELQIVVAKSPDFKTMVFFVIGGLGIFLLGMRFLSDGLQTVSGPTLKRMISLVTDNRLLATGVGVVVTGVVQSSSITTVMAVGFVNSGIMALNQAIGVILGANIGTTITGWIMVMKIGKWGLPIIGICVFIYLFSKREKIKYLALAIMGLGMIFFGLELMKNGFKPVKNMPEFIEWFTMVNATSFINVIKLASIGCILTMIVQSSSATLGIVIGLASTGVLEFETAAALVVGVNIGTTITALIASIGVNTNARRVAYFHCIFNVVGALWVILIFYQYLDIVRMLVPEVEVNGVKEFPILAGIAMTHTVFNIVNTVVFLPFTGVIGNFLMKIVKDKKIPAKDLVTNLQYSMLSSPYASIQQSKIEIDKMEKSAKEMMDDLRSIFSGSEKKDVYIKKVFKDEDKLDLMQKEVTEFLTEFLSTQIPQDVAETAKDHLRMCDELESVSDYVMQILKLKLRLEENDTRFSPEQVNNIIELHDTVKSFFDYVMECGSKEGVRDKFAEILEKSDQITRKIRTLRNDYWKTASEQKINPMVSTSYTDVLQSYRKIKNHLLNEVEVQAV
ncbi:MAG: Na/Pi cotransporter family protein [Fibrobacterales bacterium]